MKVKISQNISWLQFTIYLIKQLHNEACDILDLHVGHIGGEVQKNILSILLWASAVVGELHCLVIPERLVASQEYRIYNKKLISMIKSHLTLISKYAIS